MKTTIDLPESILYRAKVAAAERKTTLKELVTTGLEIVLQTGKESPRREAALNRLKKGFHLKGKPLTRDQAHAR